MRWWQGRGRGAVQGSAREHTPHFGAREAPAPRLACQALPDPPAPTWRQHRWTRATRQYQDHRLPGEREPRRSAVMPPRRRQTQPHQAGAVGSGRAGCARRGGNRGDRAQPRRVLACPALNGATAAAWPLRGLACDKRWGSPSPIRQLLRSNAHFRTIPQRQLRAASSGWRSVDRPRPACIRPCSGSVQREAADAGAVIGVTRVFSTPPPSTEPDTVRSRRRFVVMSNPFRISARQGSDGWAVGRLGGWAVLIGGSKGGRHNRTSTPFSTRTRVPTRNAGSSA